MGRAAGEQWAQAFRGAQVQSQAASTGAALPISAQKIAQSFHLSAYPSVIWAALAGLSGGVSDKKCSAQSLACWKYSISGSC